jgi:fumarate reductase subunit D
MKRSNEPFFWSLFGAGGVVSAMLLPALIGVLVLATGFGLAPDNALSFDRVAGALQHPLVAVVLCGVIFLTLWHCCHRIYHSLHDFGYHAPLWVKTIVYGLAVTVSGFTLLQLL